jgi:diguanylate cyclase (GGDEF)-like protein
MGKPRILIIDDDPVQRDTLADILLGRGYAVLVAKDGTEGLAIFEQNEVGLALIDLGLPDIPGMKILERIKADRPSTEAIILTGNATLDSAIDATNRGAFSYLVKPYKIDQLLLQIKRANEKREAEEKIVRHASELERINAELKALFEISLTISGTIEVEKLLSEVLQALVEVDIFPFERSAAAFLVEEDHLRLASYVGLSPAQVESCMNIPIGECICGLAITRGEIIISRNSHSDEHHSVCYADMGPHGNIALPLKILGEVIGAITLKTRPDVEINEETVRLLSTLGNQISIAVNNAKLYDEARNFSLRDHLTGLANRRFLNMQLEKSVKAAKRYREKLSVIMLDIDHFKLFNDRHGHLQGDRLLVKLAGILVEEMRSSDYVFRYGGEEFLVILPQTDLATACDAAERLRTSVESVAGVTISLGVSTYKDTMQEDEELIRAADTALYQAKQRGRNRVVASP